MKKKILLIVATLIAVGVALGVTILTTHNFGHTTNSSSVAPIQGGVTNQDLKNEKTYSVTSADKNSANYVSSGAASEVGQFTISAQGNKATLTAKSSVNQTLENGQLSYTITGTKVMENSPKTDEAVQMAQMALNTRDISGDYKTLVISYQIKNNGDSKIVTDGVYAAGFSNGASVSLNGGLDNDSSLTSGGVDAGQSKETFVVLLIATKVGNQASSVELQFAGSTDVTNSKKVTDLSKTVTIKF
jgi:hypothetical protein